MSTRISLVALVALVLLAAAIPPTAHGQVEPTSQPASQPAPEPASQPTPPEEPASRPAGSSGAPETPAKPAAPDASAATAVSQVAPLDAETLRLFEAEVERLRKTADGLSSGGEHGAAIVAAAEGRADDLDSLGIDATHVGELRGLMNEVAMLRARRHLLNVQAAVAVDDAAHPFAKVESALTPTEVEHTPPASAPAARRLAKLPQKNVELEAELLFRAGDHAAVVRLLAGEDPQRMSARSTYILGAALIGTKRREEARAAFERAAANTDSPVIADAAHRQIELLDHVKQGVVSPEPLSSREEPPARPAESKPREGGER